MFILLLLIFEKHKTAKCIPSHIRGTWLFIRDKIYCIYSLERRIISTTIFTITEYKIAMRITLN